MKQNTIIGFVAVIALLVGIVMAVYIAPPTSSEPKYMQSYPQARATSDFALTDQHGNPFTKEQLMGKWTLAFVGYTFCPDVCPTTLAELKRIYPELSQVPTSHPLQVWFLSVDPGRDTQNRLLEYVNFFNPDFVATTGGHDVLFPLVRSMGMMYSMAGSTDDPNYLVDHSGSVVVINPQGNVVGRFKPQLSDTRLAVSDGDQILADMPVLMQP